MMPTEGRHTWVVSRLSAFRIRLLLPDGLLPASQLSAVANGFATILLFALIDPQLSVMTDEVTEGKVPEALFRGTIVWISISRLLGMILAQAVLLPSAIAIAWIANYV